MHGFRRQRAGLDRSVRTLDAHAVQESGVATDEHSAGKDQLRQGLQPAFVDGARAVADALAAVERRADERMLFPALEFLEGPQVRVAVIERDDQSQEHLVAGRVIEESAAFRVVVERPAERVHGRAGCMARGSISQISLRPIP